MSSPDNETDSISGYIGRYRLYIGAPYDFQPDVH